MRNGTVAGLASPHPLIEGMPGLYQDDDFTQRWLSAMDEALAPVFLALESMPAYLDPELTPDDFLDWLAGWVGVLLDENWPIERRRAFVAQAAELYRLRGTASGLAAHVRVFTGGDVQILETGGASWSSVSGGELPGGPGYRIVNPRRLRNSRMCGRLSLPSKPDMSALQTRSTFPPVRAR